MKKYNPYGCVSDRFRKVIPKRVFDKNLDVMKELYNQRYEDTFSCEVAYTFLNKIRKRFKRFSKCDYRLGCFCGNACYCPVCNIYWRYRLAAILFDTLQQAKKTKSNDYRLIGHMRQTAIPRSIFIDTDGSYRLMDYASSFEEVIDYKGDLVTERIFRDERCFPVDKLKPRTHYTGCAALFDGQTIPLVREQIQLVRDKKYSAIYSPDVTNFGIARKLSILPSHDNYTTLLVRCHSLALVDTGSYAELQDTVKFGQSVKEDDWGPAGDTWQSGLKIMHRNTYLQRKGSTLKSVLNFVEQMFPNDMHYLKDFLPKEFLVYAGLLSQIHTTSCTGIFREKVSKDE